MTVALIVDALAPWQLAILQVVAAIACFIMAMMAAKDAQKARMLGRPIAFIVFMLFTFAFSLSMAWVLRI